MTRRRQRSEGVALAAELLAIGDARAAEAETVVARDGSVVVVTAGPKVANRVTLRTVARAYSDHSTRRSGR